MENESEALEETSALILVVDLDGTLIRSDLLWESLLAVMGRRPWLLFLVPIWWLGGRAALKGRMAALYAPAAESLPYRPEVLDYCRTAAANGRRLILASASPLPWVRAVADSLGIFEGVLGTEGDKNLKGVAKLQAIQDRLAGAPFAYIGDSPADEPIWQASEEALGAGLGRRARRCLANQPRHQELSPPPRNGPPAWLSVLRPRQWAKNGLVLVPLILAHEFSDGVRTAGVAVTFLLFCAVASAGYILNDLLDFESDRAHPTKRERPIASGELTFRHAVALLATLLIGALAVTRAWAPEGLLLMLVAYMVTTLSYSLFFKRVLLVDVLVLASLYTLRVLAGGVAGAVAVSPWLLAFSGFFFLSLALVKRHVELIQARDQALPRNRRRDYQVEDIPMIETVGVSAGLVSVLVLCLFISSSDVSRLYVTPELLWLICPAMLYWVMRIWFLARRGLLDDDPVLFATRDARSYVVAVLALIIIVAAAW
ncbi:MAG: UbiA family prenyltransferase [Myxococcota bacterium]|nr:UbiA family prenyltransferase [Myxococcota bacterium]